MRHCDLFISLPNTSRLLDCLLVVCLEDSSLCLSDFRGLDIRFDLSMLLDSVEFEFDFSFRCL